MAQALQRGSIQHRKQKSTSIQGRAGACSNVGVASQVERAIAPLMYELSLMPIASANVEQQLHRAGRGGVCTNKGGSSVTNMRAKAVQTTVACNLQRACGLVEVYSRSANNTTTCAHHVMRETWMNDMVVPPMFADKPKSKPIKKRLAVWVVQHTIDAHNWCTRCPWTRWIWNRTTPKADLADAYLHALYGAMDAFSRKGARVIAANAQFSRDSRLERIRFCLQQWRMLRTLQLAINGKA